MYPKSVAESTLQLCGGHFDTVILVIDHTGRLGPGPNRSETAIELCRRLLYFCSGMDRHYVNGKYRLETLSRTLILNQADGKPLSSEAGSMFRGWLLSTLAFCLIPLPQSNELVALWNDCCRSLGNLEEVCDMALPSEDSIRLYAQSK
jgi:hypothetical protein